MARILAILGSAETTPTMTKPHRSMFEHVGSAPAVMLDTPYGFQENVADISARAIEYFDRSVGRTVTVASLRGNDDVITKETALARVREAGLVFAGPGSPSYAIKIWNDTALSQLLREKLATGGVVVFSSAAALTVGIATVPVYEIYKAGADPHWLEGLDLLSVAGLKAAVIPHYDNAEGGHHDTRFCYMGERRLAIMERQLPDDAFVLGVDEHTGLIMDLDAGTATVVGLGGVTIRKHGESFVIPTGALVRIEELQPGGRAVTSVTPAPLPSTATGDAPAIRLPLLEAATRLESEFAAALGRRDVSAATAAVLELEQTICDWSGDNAATDEPDRARSMLRSMVVRLGELAVGGSRDPRDVVGPIVEVVMSQRAQARTDKQWAKSDELRDALAAVGVEVRDDRDGATWHLIDPDQKP
jgi:cyanophycinase-like exopeptidase